MLNSMAIPEHIFQQTEAYFATHWGEAGLRIYLALFGVGLILLAMFAPYRTPYTVVFLALVAAYVSLP